MSELLSRHERGEVIDDLITVHDQHYIRATVALADERTRVLKHGDTFAVFDRFGDVRPLGRGDQGVFDRGTRFLSRFDVTLWGGRPLVLGSSVREDNAVFIINLTNPDRTVDGAATIEKDTIHLLREQVLLDGTLYLSLRIRNYGRAAVPLELATRFDADFVDIFEVRGTPRASRGVRLAPAVSRDRVTLGYQGLDRVVRRTVLRFTPAPARLDAGEATWSLVLEPGRETAFEVTVRCEGEHVPGPTVGWRAALVRSRDDARAVLAEGCLIETSSPPFNALLRRSTADLGMMVTRTPYGPYPYGGVPWFCTAFGRDGLITALELLWVEPEIAAGVLRFLAAEQATETRPEADAEAGKILHERRDGEMAALGEVPFGQYYGSIDATPLFLLLLGAYHERTGDDALVDDLWSAVERALDWIDRYGDRDGDGFIEYARSTEHGLQQQGWKDSNDSVFHADGRLARGPIALCEVQAYVYGAWCKLEDLCRRRGDLPRARELHERAVEMKRRFEERFWVPELGTYALALDGEKEPCRVRTSNAGHVLLTGLAAAERAAGVARGLLDYAGFSGWGIRTVAASEARYNPMSYHNGSIWPHDNAMVAAGLSQYGMQSEAARILEAMVDASVFMDLRRLPELFCGFPRVPDEGPTLYPVACAPQSWAAGAVHLVLQACFGLSIDGRAGRVLFSSPCLPPFLTTVQLRNLRVGRGRVDLELHRFPHDVGVHVTRREGNVEVVCVK